MTQAQLWSMIGSGLLETLYITFVSTLFAYLLGLPLGVLLVTTQRDHITPAPFLHRMLDTLVNILRSVPFLILMIAVIPLTRVLVGRAIGTTATIVPLVIAAFPFVARTIESSLLEVDRGVIEAAQAMGASRLQIIRKVILPEAMPSLVNGAAIATTNILGYTAMAGAIGGGGLGAFAITYGHHRHNLTVLYLCVVVLVVVVQAIQYLGTTLSHRIDHRAK